MHFTKTISIEGNKFQLIPNPICFAFLFLGGGGQSYPNINENSFIWTPNQMCILMMIVPLSIQVRYYIICEYEYSMISFGVVQLYIHYHYYIEIEMFSLNWEDNLKINIIAFSSCNYCPLNDQGYTFQICMKFQTNNINDCLMSKFQNKYPLPKLG